MQPVLAIFIIGLLNLVVGFAFATRAVWGNWQGSGRWKFLSGSRSRNRQQQLDALEMLECQQAAADAPRDPVVDELIRSLQGTATRLRELLHSLEESEGETESIDSCRVELGEVCSGLLGLLKETAEGLGDGNNLESTLLGQVAQLERLANSLKEIDCQTDAIPRLAADAKAVQGTVMGLLTNLEARQYATQLAMAGSAS